ncbi:MAG: hypothetical protein LLF75_11400 [Eubacteriales bacterium]|nr:hypothetical protein [Eubacteriales bacterium]
MEKKHGSMLLLLAVVCVAVYLRASITAVGPLISSMRESIPFYSGVFGLLTQFRSLWLRRFHPR